MSVKDVTGKGKAWTRPAPGVISQRLMCWTWRVVWLGRLRALEVEDLPGFLPSFCAKHIADQAIPLWDSEMKKKTPSLPRVLLRLSRGALLWGIVSSVSHGFLVAFLRPMLLRYVIGHIDRLIVRDLIFFVIVMILEGFLQLWLKQFLVERLSAVCIATCSALVAKRIPKTAEQQSTTKLAKSSEVALIGNDLIRTVENSAQLLMLFTSIVQLICVVVALLIVVGPPGLLGCAVCAISVFNGTMLSRLNKKIDNIIMNHTHRRINLLKQILDGVRFIKVSAWEDFYMRKSASIRSVETSHQRRYRTFNMMNATNGRATPPVACMVTFVGMAFMGKPMKAEDIFTVLSLFMTLRLPLGALPNCMTALFVALNSFNRIGRTLMQPNIVAQPDEENTSYVASLRNVDLQWSGSGPLVLVGVSIDVKWGHCMGMMGAVASGKTTLLMSMLGGLVPSRGIASRSSTCQTVGYVPQRPVVFSGSLLNNIIMGHPFDEKRLKVVLESAQFVRDLDLMPNGIQTEVGERGTTLSGGQQMRLNIARALYHDPQLLIADDPLAAVDVHVASMIFEALLRWQKGSQAERLPTVCDIDQQGADLLNGIVPIFGQDHDQRTLVMSLNQLHFLPQFDQIVYLNEGRVDFQGSYRELQQCVLQNNALASLMESSSMASTCDIVAPNPDHPTASLAGGPITQLGAPSNKTMPAEGVQLVKAEHRVRGSMSNNVFMQYLKAIGALRLGSYLSLTFIAYALLAANDWFLTWWIADVKANGDDKSVKMRGAAIYAGLTLAHAIGMLSANFASGYAGAHASRNLHKSALSRVLHAPVSWFEETPSGRTLSKFSADLDGIDLKLPEMLDHCCQTTATLTVIVTSICVIVPWLATFVAVVLPLYLVLDHTVNKSSREIKRMTTLSLGPVLTLVQEACSARLLVRVMQQDHWLYEQTLNCIDCYNHLQFTSQSMLSFLRLIGNLMGSTVSILVLFFFWAKPGLAEAAPGASTGLALTYSFLIPYFLSFMSLFASMARLFLAGLERLLELQSERVPQEKPWLCENDPAQAQWPVKGGIEFQEATLRYRPHLPPAINKLTLAIRGGERLGVVGRTGAGKSSLSILLLRVVEPGSGTILIDGQDICKIGLHALRRAVAIVPQEPFLFEGTLSQNLDPLGLMSFEDLSGALARVQLPMSLDAQVGSGGGELSAGERQLIAIARATLSTARIVIMDEPTASCDTETDDRLQEVTRVAFSSRTVLCIAHRLNTVMEYDRILVMEAGSIAELDSPANLLANPDGHFAQMVAKMRTATASEE